MNQIELSYIMFMKVTNYSQILTLNIYLSARRKFKGSNLNKKFIRKFNYLDCVLR